jgi:hypothetical protein
MWQRNGNPPGDPGLRAQGSGLARVARQPRSGNARVACQPRAAQRDAAER